ncbi:hypothetical protein ASD51_34155 [Streptomyces sp. Root55]|nr:hypothetical protein ASD51_34155 [Streptomyces sp. Root55]
MASVPESTRCHSPSGDVTPPGKRQAMPTTAIGSDSAASSAAILRLAFCRSTVTRLRYSTSFSSFDGLDIGLMLLGRKAEWQGAGRSGEGPPDRLGVPCPPPGRTGR